MTVKEGDNIYHKDETMFDYSISLVKKQYEDDPAHVMYWELKIDNKEFLFKNILKAQEFAKNYKK